MIRARDVLNRLIPITALFAAVVWLIFPYLDGSVIGGGDSVWYHHQAKDAVEQVRAGQFPIWVGQSHFSYNGSIHPHRSAPALLNTVAAVDWLTAHAFTSSLLLNWLVAGALVFGAVSCYAALRRLADVERNSAALLAWIYAACPGVVGLIVAQDLYMSSFALPWIPWVFLGVLRASAGSTLKTSVLIGGAAGLLFWCHAPIALWTCFAAGLLAAFLFLFSTTNVLRFAKTLVVAIPVFVVTAAYPIVSVVSLRVPGDRLVPDKVLVEDIMRELHGVFPQVLEPVHVGAARLSVLQPGYAVLLLVVLGLLGGVFATRRSSRASIPPALAAGVLLVFIFPIPWVTVGAWEALPDFWRSMTNIWPNQRLVPPIACLGVAGFAYVLRAQTRWREWLGRVMLVAAAWSLWEASTIRSIAVTASMGRERTAQLMRPENANLSIYSYQQLPIRPANFIHGVTSPAMEFRWRNSKSPDLVSLKSWVEAKMDSPWTALEFAAVANSPFFGSSRSWQVEPGKLYLLSFRFDDPAVSGVLRVRGKRLDRAYLLPSAGGPSGFGSAEGQETSIAVWTDGPDTETFSLSFEPKDSKRFLVHSAWQVRLLEVNRDQLPINVEATIPLKLTLHRWEGGVIETPRMYIPGWTARADGKPLQGARGVDGRFEIVVPAGVSEMMISYEPTLSMRITFWMGIAVFCGFWGVIFLAIFRPEPLPSP